MGKISGKAVSATSPTRPKYERLGLLRRLDRIADHRVTPITIAICYALLLVFLGLRFHLMGDGEVESDFFEAYIVQAGAFLDGHIIADPYRGPLYPIVLATLSVVLRPFGAGFFETAIVLSALASGLSVFLTYKLLKIIFDPRVALGTIVVLVLNPIFIRYSYTTGTDALFVAVVIAAMYVLLRQSVFQWRALALSTVLVTLAYLVRYNGAMAVLGLVLSVLVVNIWKLSWTKRLTAVALVMILFFALIAPWGLYTQTEYGTFFYNKNYRNVALSLFPEGSDSETLPLDEFDNLWDVVTYSPVQVLKTLPSRIFTYTARVLIRVMRWPIGLAVLFGLSVLVTRRPTRPQLAYFLFGFLFLAVTWGVFYNDRFMLLHVPILAAMAMVGVLQFTSSPVNRLIRMAIGVVVAALIAYSGWASWVYNKEEIDGGPIAYRRMGEWLAQNKTANLNPGKLIARKPHTAYFAGMVYVRLPILESHDELLKFCAETQSDYLFYSSIAERTRAGLRHLVDHKAQHPGLVTIAGNSEGVLYMIDKAVLPLLK